MKRVLVGIGIALAIAGAAPAQQPPEQPAAPADAEPLRDVKLLDESPGYWTALSNQWSASDVPHGFEAWEEDVEHFGRLLDVGTPQKLTLAECIQLALSRNTELRLQRLGPLAARAGVRSAQSIFDPVAFANFNYDRSRALSSSFVAPLTQSVDPALAGTLALLGPPVNVTHNVAASGGLRKLLRSGGQLSLAWQNNRLKSNSSFIRLQPQYTTDLTLSLNQPLLRDFGLRFTTLLVRVARNTQDVAMYQYEAAIAAIVKQVEAAYWGLVQANENVRVQEQGLAAAKELQRQIEGKFRVGALPHTAVLEAKAEVARREANLIQARNAQTIARDNLRALVNFQPEGSRALSLIEPGETPEVAARRFDVQESLAKALEKRPELQAAKLDVHGKAMLVKLAENQLLPRLNAVGAVGTSGLSGGEVVTPFTDRTTGQTTLVVNPFAGPYSDALNRLVDGRYYNYSAGVTFEIPLSNAQAKADYARARVDLESSRRNLQKQQEAVTLEVKKAVTSLESDLKSIEATRIARELAEENLRNQKARYDVGLATTKDLLDFQDRLTQAQAAEVQALTTYAIDLAELRRAEGTLLEEHRIVVQREEEPTPWWARF